jgi:two-component system, NarL family, response regulator DevR
MRETPVRETGGATAVTRLIRCFLVDDHEVVRRGVAEMLGHAGDIEIVGEAATAAQALTRIRAVRPDVVVIDVRLPDGDGPSVCRELRTTLVPAPAFLFFTSYTDHAPLFAAVDAGAAGFLLKEVNRLGLVEGVRRVAAGGSMLDPRLMPAVLDRLRHGRPEPGHELSDSCPVDPRASTLTAREHLILELISEGLTNRQIGIRLHLAEKTVKNNVTTLLRKLGFSRRTEAAAYAARHPTD